MTQTRKEKTGADGYGYYFTEDELSARGKWAIAVHQVLIVITVFVHTNSVRRLA